MPKTATAQDNSTTNGNKTPEKTPAVDLLVSFLKQQDIVLIIDETDKLSKDADGLLYTVNPTKRLRAFYKDQLEANGQEKKVDIPGN